MCVVREGFHKCKLVMLLKKMRSCLLCQTHFTVNIRVVSATVGNLSVSSNVSSPNVVMTMCVIPMLS